MTRAFDVAASVLGLILTSPVLAVSALAIKLDSRGPVIYRQRRAGRDGRPFDLYKLRTMRPGADPVGVGTPVLEGDPRVTRAGGVLRRFSLDEIPNLWNVGDGVKRYAEGGIEACTKLAKIVVEEIVENHTPTRAAIASATNNAPRRGWTTANQYTATATNAPATTSRTTVRARIGEL